MDRTGGLGASIWANGTARFATPSRKTAPNPSSSSSPYYQSRSYSSPSTPAPPPVPLDTATSTITTSINKPLLPPHPPAHPASTTTTGPATNGIVSKSSAAISSSSSTRLTPPQAFHRFEQACQRLRWKFIDLQTSYHRATSSPDDFGFAPADAERNFKVDFHEFYVWIEQAIVLLLLVFGVSVSRASTLASNFHGRSAGNNNTISSHAYHHNVLKALDDPSCPVHPALGQGPVNQALWKAKELRNRWKDAAEGRETPPLKMYDLRWIVTEVLNGLEEGYTVAAQQTQVHAQMELELQQERQAAAAAAVAAAAGSHDGVVGGVIDGVVVADGVAETNLMVDDDEWEWMVEPMDWEAA